MKKHLFTLILLLALAAGCQAQRFKPSAVEEALEVLGLIKKAEPVPPVRRPLYVPETVNKPHLSELGGTGASILKRPGTIYETAPNTLLTPEERYLEELRRSIAVLNKPVGAIKPDASLLLAPAVIAGHGTAEKATAHVSGQLSALGFGGSGKSFGSFQLWRFNKTFGRPIDAKWGKEADVIANRFKKKLAVIRGGHEDLMEAQGIYRLAGDGSPGISVFLLTDGPNAYVASFQRAKGKTPELGSLLPAKGKSLLYAQVGFSKRVGALPQREVKYLYVSSLVTEGKTNTVAVSYGGNIYTMKVGAVNAYQELTVQLKALIAGEKADKVVLLLDPFQRLQPENLAFEQQPLLANNGYGMQLATVSPTRLMHDLQEGSATEFYLGTRFDAAEKIGTLPAVASRSDLELVIPDRSFSEQDRISVPILNKIAERGLKYSVVNGELTTELLPNVLVFSGHNGEALWSFLEQLGQAGRLEGKVLIMYACHESADIAKYAALIAKYKVKNVLRFPYKIDPGAVKAVLLKIGGELETGGNFQQLWRKAAQAAYDDPNPSFAPLKPEIQKLIYIQNQISVIYKHYLKNSYS